ncbi:hypothetical protein STANM309S_06013 [Streptomyces tanashiensis]
MVVKAADPQVLKKASEQVRSAIAGLNDVTDVQSDLAQSVPRISVKANAQAADAGFDTASLGATVAQAVRGTPAAKATLDDSRAGRPDHARPSPATTAGRAQGAARSAR